jgi:hypothetical protein
MRMLSRILKDRSLWEAPYVDAWTIPHFLSGLFIGWMIVTLEFNIWLGLGVSIALAIGWELFEKVTHLSDVEHHTNGPSDIVVAQVGYGVGVWLLLTYGGSGIDTIVLAAAAIVFVVVSTLGWLSHHWYGTK